MPPELRVDQGDNRILAVAKDLQENSAEGTVFFVTKDINLRIKADTIGMKAEDYQSDKVPVEELYTGTGEILLSKEEVDQFFEGGSLSIEGEFFANQGVTLIDETNSSHSAIGRYNAMTGEVVALLKTPKEGVWGIHPRNRGTAICLRPAAQ